MFEYLKTQVQSAPFNKGYKAQIKLYEEIASDPEAVLAGAELLCKIDETCGKLDNEMKCTLRETIDAVSSHFDQP
jgi:hypothetical protein